MAATSAIGPPLHEKIDISEMAKDDFCADIKQKRNSAEGGGHRKLGPTSSLTGQMPEFRSRHQSDSKSKQPPRLNIYKRPDSSTAPPSPRLQSSTFFGKEPPTPTGSSQNSVDRRARSPKPFKRQSWLQRSWYAARSKANQIPDNSSFSTPPPTRSDRIVNGNHHEKKSPLPPANALAGFLDRLKSRSNSEAVCPERTALSLGPKRKTGFASKPSDHLSSPITERWIYERRDSSLDALSKEVEEDSVFEDEPMMRPARRKRSRSDAASYIIMRKTSRPNTAEVMGSISNRDIACKQLLKKFTCYDLMPTRGALVTIDSQISTDLALAILAENGVRAAFLWDARQRTPICLVTVTDFLRIIYAHFFALSPTLDSRMRSADNAQKCLSDLLKQPILPNLISTSNLESSGPPRRQFLCSVTSEENLLSALTVLRLNRLHRLPVMEPETGNPLYLLSSKRILHFLHNHMHSLPMSSFMYKTLDELQIGTWEKSTARPFNVISISPGNSMFEAVEKFLRCGVSSLPVIEEILTGNNANCSASCQPPKNRLIDALTKVDLMHFVVEKGWTDLQEKTVADVLKQRHENMESVVTCHGRMPFALAIDRLVSSNAHRIYVIDSEGVLHGVLSIADVLSYLNEKSIDLMQK